jgi:hypothetical protein
MLLQVLASVRDDKRTKGAGTRARGKRSDDRLDKRVVRRFVDDAGNGKLPLGLELSDLRGSRRPEIPIDDDLEVVQAEPCLHELHTRALRASLLWRIEPQIREVG